MPRSRVDGERSTKLFADFALLRASRRRKYGIAARRAQLNGSRSNSARAAMHKDAFAGCEPRGIDQIGPDGKMHFRQCRSRHKFHGWRNRQHTVRRGRRVVGITAAPQQCADRLAHSEFRNAAADFDDFAGDFHAEDVGCTGRRRIASHGLCDVGAIKARCCNLDEHFVMGGNGSWGVDHRQTVVRACIVHANGFHQTFPACHVPAEQPTITRQLGAGSNGRRP